MRVRDVEAADIPQIREIVCGVMPERADYVLAAATQKEMLVAQSGDATTGFLVWNREFFGRPFCWLLISAPAHRRQGVAASLLDAFELRCGGERVYTSTNHSNAAMHRLLTQRGYIRRGEVDVDPGDSEIFYSKG